MRAYLRNLSLWARGIRWLWSRRWIAYLPVRGGVDLFADGNTSAPDTYGIKYKPGWGPWRFLPVYLTTYLAGTLAGYGVVSLSRAWYDRREKARFAATMTLLLDWAFPGSAHGRHTGPRLWGSVNLRD
jgi:hypothetical protein